MTGIFSIIVLILGWYYWRNLDWQIKLVTARLNKIICAQERDRQGVQRVLKMIYVIINKSMVVHNSIAVYQSLDLLKLSFGYGLVRPRESSHLMGICVVALRCKKPDTVSFALDVFKPLVRQLPPEEVVSAVEQLTLIGAMALRQKYNFLAAKVLECIFSIMEQTHGAADREIVVASIKALKVMGVLGLRRRDMALFREMNIRLSGWSEGTRNHDVGNEITKMLSAWLYRIVGLNDVALFVMLTDLTTSLVQAEALSGAGIELLIDEWGDVAATACLNPTSPLAGLIIEFIFKVVSGAESNTQWLKVVRVAGRVAKLAVDRHGLIIAFMVVRPILEVGRNLLWIELKFVEYIDELHQQQLFTVVRECLIILNYVTKKNMFGSTGETIVELFTCWIGCSGNNGNHRSIKKYCQLLLLFWLKNKRQGKRYTPCNVEFIQPLLFSEIEKQRLGL